MGFSHFQSVYYPAGVPCRMSITRLNGQVAVNFTVIIPRRHLVYSVLITKMPACLSHSLVLRVQCVHDHPEEVSFLYFIIGPLLPHSRFPSSAASWSLSNIVKFPPVRYYQISSAIAGTALYSVFCGGMGKRERKRKRSHVPGKSS